MALFEAANNNDNNDNNNNNKIKVKTYGWLVPLTLAYSCYLIPSMQNIGSCFISKVTILSGIQTLL